LFVSQADMQVITRLRREQQGGTLQGNWTETFELADSGVHGVLHIARSRRWQAPEVGYEIQGPDGRIVTELEIAWPQRKVGVAIDQEAMEIACRHGWQAWSMIEAIERFEGM
jgi:hypothetical protein